MEGVTYPVICRHICVGVVVHAGAEGTWREHDDDDGHPRSLAVGLFAA